MIWVFCCCAGYCNWQGHVQIYGCCHWMCLCTCIFMSGCRCDCYWSDSYEERKNNCSDCRKVRGQQWVEERWAAAVVSVCRSLWWMWQSVCYLMSLRHGWETVIERSFLSRWHHTVAQIGFDVCWQFVTLVLQLTLAIECCGKKKEKRKKKTWKCRNNALEWIVSLSYPVIQKILIQTK